VVEEEKGSLHGGGAPFIVGGGGWQRQLEPRAERWHGEAVGTEKCSGRGLNVVSTGSAVVRTGRLTGGPQWFWIFFPIYPKLAQL
jgi:hypothetical protein